MPDLKKQQINIFGFTLIELLVVVSIIGMLIGLTLLGLQGSRQSARDARRRSDIELVRSGLELYKSDCKKYPIGDIFTLSPTKLIGDGTITSCAVTNNYINDIPKDPYFPNRIYRYVSDGVTYSICGSLEGGGTAVDCGGLTQCGGTNSCNYKATNP